LDGAARGARHDDATATDADPRTDGRQEEREALLAKGTLEGGGHPDVVPHPDPSRQFDVPSGPPVSAMKGFRFRKPEQRCHPFRGDPSLHAAVSALRHRTATRMRG